MWASFKNFLLTTAAMVPFFGPPVPPTTSFRLGTKGACLDPTYRREWRTMSKVERTEWISAIQCIANMPHNTSVIETQYLPDNPPIDPNSSYYDDYVYTHMDLVANIHLTGYFFPWHRNFIHVIEAAMQKHCGYKGAMPWWDWTKDSADLYNSQFFKDTDPSSGLGGWGNPAADMEVQDGALAGFRVTYPYQHTLRRNYTLQPWLHGGRFYEASDKMANQSFTASEYDRLVNTYVGDYPGFQTDVEDWKGIHFGIHDIVGGDLAAYCTAGAPSTCHDIWRAYTPNDPVFWLHHATIDKLWSDWQNKHPENKHAFSGGSMPAQDKDTYRKYPVGLPPALELSDRLPTTGLFGEVRISDVLSTTGGYLCYVYI